MQTSLQAIANKAAKDSKYRFENLFRMLNKENTIDSFRMLNKKAATGVDQISFQEFGLNLEKNVEELIEQVKRGSYKAKLVRRQYIPKSNGKLRPLGIPATADKLLQKVVARILEAIYEQDFLASSFGYRNNIGPLDAVKELSRELQFGKYNYLVEADIRGYFDSIDHKVLVEMLKQRIKDKPFIRLIEKWLKAGVLDTDGKVLDPIAGVPQGGIVSPVLSNVYLHYTLDLWFEKVVKKHCKGKAYQCRFADDFVCAFEKEEDAKRFYKVLGKRLNKFGLTLAEEKTNLINFSRYNKQKANKFEFLGFEYFWSVSRDRKDLLKRRTARKKLANSLASIKLWIKQNRSVKLKDFFSQLNSKLRGYYNYYGIIGNFSSIKYYFDQVVNLLKKWLNRRSQKASYNWLGFLDMLNHYKIVKPKITEKPLAKKFFF
jgi:RNA-directed DNA polymerase